MNGGFGKDFYRTGNAVKRSGRFSEPPDSENWKVAVLIPFPKIFKSALKLLPVQKRDAQQKAHADLQCSNPLVLRR